MICRRRERDKSGVAVPRECGLVSAMVQTASLGMMVRAERCALAGARAGGW